jgi:hypothetical protein
MLSRSHSAIRRRIDKLNRLYDDKIFNVNKVGENSIKVLTKEGKEIGKICQECWEIIKQAEPYSPYLEYNQTTKDK